MVRPILRPLFQRAVRGAQSPGGRMFMAGSAPVWLDTLTDPGSALDVDITETISTDLSNVAENSDQKNKKPNEQEIRDWLEGNICRCTGYQGIVAAVKDAASKM